MSRMRKSTAQDLGGKEVEGGMIESGEGRDLSQKRNELATDGARIIAMFPREWQLLHFPLTYFYRWKKIQFLNYIFFPNWLDFHCSNGTCSYVYFGHAMRFSPPKLQITGIYMFSRLISSFLMYAHYAIYPRSDLGLKSLSDIFKLFMYFVVCTFFGGDFWLKVILVESHFGWKSFWLKVILVESHIVLRFLFIFVGFNGICHPEPWSRSLPI